MVWYCPIALGHCIFSPCFSLCVSVWVISLDPIPLGNFSVFRFTENFLSFVVALHIEDGLSTLLLHFFSISIFFLGGSVSWSSLFVNSFCKSFPQSFNIWIIILNSLFDNLTSYVFCCLFCQLTIVLVLPFQMFHNVWLKLGSASMILFALSEQAKGLAHEVEFSQVTCNNL